MPALTSSVFAFYHRNVNVLSSLVSTNTWKSRLYNNLEPQAITSDLMWKLKIMIKLSKKTILQDKKKSHYNTKNMATDHC